MAQVLLNNAYPRILVAQWRVPFRNEHFFVEQGRTRVCGEAY
jgi:hypothetical protein